MSSQPRSISGKHLDGLVCPPTHRPLPPEVPLQPRAGGAASADLMADGCHGDWAKAGFY